MSDYRETQVSITIDGDEHDVFVRGFVEIEASQATVDGDIDVMINGTWCPLASVNVEAGDAGHIEQSLCEAALEDRNEAAE